MVGNDAAQQSMTNERFLRIEEVEDRVGLKQSSIYEFIKLGAFPKQVLIGKRSVAWLESEINEWIQNCIRQREENDQRT